MRPEHPFHIFGIAHLVVIGLTLVIPFAFALLVRWRPRPALEKAFEISLSILLATNFIGYAIYTRINFDLPWAQALPMQLCDWATVVVIVALLTHRRTWFDVAYFWGIAGTFQAILTPNLAFDFPDPRFVSFFVAHSGIVVGVLYLMAAYGFRPHLNSIWRTLLWSQVYLVTTLIVDQLTGVNYGFLLHKPPITSLLSLLSDWRPLYILQLNGLAVLFFALLYSPFAVLDFARRRSSVGMNNRRPETRSLRPS